MLDPDFCLLNYINIWNSFVIQQIDVLLHMLPVFYLGRHTSSPFCVKKYWPIYKSSVFLKCKSIFTLYGYLGHTWDLESRAEVTRSISLYLELPKQQDAQLAVVRQRTEVLGDSCYKNRKSTMFIWKEMNFVNEKWVIIICISSYLKL